jgi:Sjoegren syndrome nuclear autoantigen 1
LWLAAGIEDLREKREQIMKQIQDEEMEKQRVQQELAALTQRLSRVNESLARKVGAASMQVAQLTVVAKLWLNPT